MAACGMMKRSMTKVIVAIAMVLLAGEGAKAVTFSYLDTQPSCKSLTISSSGSITCNTTGTNDVPFNFASSLTCTTGLAINSTSGAVDCADKQLPKCELSAAPSQAAPGDTVVLTAACANSPTSYQWTKADSLVAGSGNTATVTLPTTATSAAYAYSMAGVNAQGTGNLASTTITVARAGQKGPFAFVAHQVDAPPLPGNLSVIDILTNQLATTIKVGVYPLGVAVSPDETRVYIANSGSNTVSVVDVLTSAVTATIDVGVSPNGIAVNHAGSKVYVANTNSNTVSVIDTATLKVITTVPVGDKPHGVAVNRSDSRVYVSNYAANTISVIDAATGTAISPAIAVGTKPEGIAASGNRVFVVNSGSDSLSIIDTAAANAVTTVNVGKTPQGIAVNPAGTQVYVANNGDWTVSVVDIATSTVANTVLVGIMPTFVEFDPTGSLAYVTSQGALAVIDTAAGVTVPNKTLSVSSGALYAYGKFISGNPENYRGLWWNPAESGWGMSIAQHNDMIFGALYSYDQAGKAAWYVMDSCPLLGVSCTSNIYKVSGGTSPLVAWNGASKAVTKVGTGTLAFADADNASFTFTIDDKPGSKAITRQVFKTDGAQANTDYTDLWWNTGESGWGVQVTQQHETIFATWYTYDAQGNATWYVASDCKMSASGCTGDLYQVTGGSALTAPWSAASKVTTAVGTVTIAFTDPSNGTMNYTINGTSASRAITRQAF